MKDNHNHPQKMDSLVDSIEDQLQEILTKKKEEIESSLEDRIRKERDEAQRRLEEIERDYDEEKEGLLTYREKLSEIERQRDEIKRQIKDHLDQALSFQTEISGLTGKTLDELKKVGELNQKLEDFQRQAESELINLKQSLEDKYGIVTALPENDMDERVDFNLDQELDKLKKIKELLGAQGIDAEQADIYSPTEDPGEDEEIAAMSSDEALPQEDEISQGTEDLLPDEELKEADQSLEEISEQDEASSEEPVTGATPDEMARDDDSEAQGETEEAGEGSESASVVEQVVEYETVSEDDEIQPSEGDEYSSDLNKEAEETIPSEDDVAESQTDAELSEGESDEDSISLDDEDRPALEEVNFQKIFEKLEQHRKGSCSEDNGEVSYFEVDGKTIVDGECLISSLTNALDGAKKLYAKLNETESPKEQFFIKQDIIRHQEVLRKLVLASIKMCEKESCSLPRYTEKILHVDALKTILEKISMENWSDEQDFLEFEKYADDLKDSYYARITPPSGYLQSILDELDKKQ